MVPKLVETTKVRPKTYKELEREENVRPKDALLKPKGDVKIKTPKLPQSRRVLRIDHANIEPSVAIKLAISEMPQKDLDLAKECGVVLEELIRAAEKGLSKYIILDKFEPLPVENWLTRKQEERTKAAIEEERLRNEALAEHSAYLKEKIIKKRGDLDWQGRYKKKMKSILKEIRRKNNPNEQGRNRDKKHLEELEKYYKEQKDKVKKHRDKMKVMEKELEKSISVRRSQQALHRANEFREFNQKEVKKQQNQFRKIEKFYRYQSAASLRASNIEIQKKQLEPIKSAYVKEFKDLRKKLEAKQEEREKNIEEILKNPLYKDFQARHRHQLKTIYQTYLRQENYELRDPGDPDLLPHSGVKHFCKDFKIVPFIITPVEEDKLFKRFTIQKHVETENGEPGFNYKQWERFLVEIACRKTKLFSKLFDQKVATLQDFDMRESQREAYNSKMAEIKAKAEEQAKRKKAKESGVASITVIDKPVVEDARIKEQEAKKRLEEKAKRREDEEDYVRKVSLTSVKYMEGLVAFLNVPDIKAGITDVIIKNQSAKTLPTRSLLKGRPD
jgi:hypothetical protein